MEIIENKSLPLLNINVKKTDNRWIINTKHEVILKNNINEYGCVEKFIEIDDAIIAEYNIKNSLCKILKTKETPNINLFNKYADVVDNMKHFTCLKIDNSTDHNDISKCIEICKKNNDCIFAMHDISKNKCEFINSNDKKNNKLYIKM